ncbi:phytanoyl-CoA dioxygenase family protein [Paenibacillus aceris]|uniref:Phytanoyl-CoA hydroxylase n=1 Tax=Paenibacillus aceris TaxID=869555 RepID=A0ABS4I6J2_9BACL|nr:phytanoyl-CoA dioxygenase family protein [Paenibacillus aceris]MBP1966542.1 phytanoyl-CoA hydroxylase [Paenibacillus aceris]NHW39486.1 phytanoyl-CoA dioxygenase family protein [Paenibacillus aceris]
MLKVNSPEEISAQLYRYDHIADKLQGFANWNRQQLEKYRRDGYMAVEHVLNENEIQTAKDALHELIFVDVKGAQIQFSRPSSELRTHEERELAVRKVHEFVDCEERLRQIAYHPEIMAAVHDILGDEPLLVQDMALLKPPHGGGEKPWHQDMAYGNLAYDKQVVGVWIALDEAALDNGCMHVIPGSQADGATPHYAVRDWQLCDAHVDIEKDVAVPLLPGGVLLFHGLLKHGTPYNLSPKKRRALQFHYVGKSAAKLTPKEYKRFFTNEMTGAEC